MKCRPFSCFVLLVFLFMAGCSTEIQHGLSERQANKIIVLLSKNGIQATKEKNASGREVMWSIQVGKSEAINAIRLLQKNNLPPQKEKDFSQVYGQSGMIPTASQERARYLMALSGELNKTLKKIDGVISARVHIVIPKDRILTRPDEKKPQPTASVLLNVSTSNFTSPGQKNYWLKNLNKDTKHLVAGSVEALALDNVHVIVRLSQLESSSAMTDRPNSERSKQQNIPGGRIIGPSGPELTTILTIDVAKAHAMRLKFMLGFMVLLLVVFISLFVWFFTRSASLKNRLNVLSS